MGGYLYRFSSFAAEIDDMDICYVLRDGDNATNDIFYFSIEDSGKFLSFFFVLKRAFLNRLIPIKHEINPCYAAC